MQLLRMPRKPRPYNAAIAKREESTSKESSVEVENPDDEIVGNAQTKKSKDHFSGKRRQQ